MRKQATTLVYVGVGLAVFEDIPMTILALLWLARVGGEPDATVLISMMMGAGMVRIGSSGFWLLHSTFGRCT